MTNTNLQPYFINNLHSNKKRQENKQNIQKAFLTKVILLLLPDSFGTKTIRRLMLFTEQQ